MTDTWGVGIIGPTNNRSVRNGKEETVQSRIQITGCQIGR